MKIDLPTILSRLDRNDMDIFASMADTPDMQKDLVKNASWMLPQWMTSAYDDATHRNMVVMFDAVCNEGWDKLYTHPELQLKLMAVIGSGRKTRHKFSRPSHSGNRAYMNSRLVEMIQVDHPDIRDDEVIRWCKLNDANHVKELMDADAIMEDKVRKDIMKLFKKLKETA